MSERIAILAGDYMAANRQLGMESNEVHKREIGRQIAYLEQQMNEVAGDLANLGAASDDANQRFIALEATLPRIDFKIPLRTFDSVRETFTEDCGAGLFFVQRSDRMAGELCVQRLGLHLRDDTQDFRHIPVTLTSNYEADERAIVRALGKYFGVTVDENDLSEDRLKEHAAALIRNLCNGLQPGSVRLIEVCRWDYLSRRSDSLVWFLHNLWVPLLDELPKIAEQGNLEIKIVVVISIDDAMPPECLVHCVDGATGQIDTKRFIELPLSNWTAKDVRTWLITHQQRKAEEAQRMATRIHNASDGVPVQVISQLRKELA